MHKKAFSSNQLGALATMALMAVWGVWVSWLHMTRPLGMELTEVLFLSALAPGYLISLPLYWRRVRWGYISGVIFLLGLFGGLAKTLIDNTFFFSLSVYNLSIVAILMAALACMYFSLRAYMETRPIARWKSILGVGSLLAICALGVWWVSSSDMANENEQLRRAVEGVQTRTDGIAPLENKISALMREGDLSGMVAAILVSDEIVSIRAYGVQSDPALIYDIGSITKSFTATAVMQLYERGLIDLDEDVNRYLPFVLRHPDYPDEPITIRMLLTNRSCLVHNTQTYYGYSMGPALRQWGAAKRGWEILQEVDNLSYDQFMAAYLSPGGTYYQPENWASCRPGSEFVYSTPGFDILGALIEQVSGQSFPNYLQQHIFTPLEMSSATATPLDHPERIAPPYERWYGVLAKTNVTLPLSQRRIIGGGGLYATAGDLANFLLAHMNQGKFGDTKLLQPESIDLMHSKVSNATNDFMQAGYGYGWSLLQEDPRQLWEITYHPRSAGGHGGRSWGYSSAMYMVEDVGGAYGYVALFNNSMAESMDQPMALAVQMNIQDLLLGEAYRIVQAR